MSTENSPAISNPVIKLVSVTRVIEVDADDDISILGEYSDTPGPGAIDREARGDMREREYRYFNTAYYDPEHPEYALADYQRAEAFNAGEWNYEVRGYSATLEIAGRSATVIASSYFGVESDADDEVQAEVFADARIEAAEWLLACGIPAATVTAALDAADAAKPKHK